MRHAPVRGAVGRGASVYILLPTGELRRYAYDLTTEKWRVWDHLIMTGLNDFVSVAAAGDGVLHLQKASGETAA